MPQANCQEQARVKLEIALHCSSKYQYKTRNRSFLRKIEQETLTIDRVNFLHDDPCTSKRSRRISNDHIVAKKDFYTRKASNESSEVLDCQQSFENETSIRAGCVVPLCDLVTSRWGSILRCEFEQSVDCAETFASRQHQPKDPECLWSR